MKEFINVLLALLCISLLTEHRVSGQPLVQSLEVAIQSTIDGPSIEPSGGIFPTSIHLARVAVLSDSALPAGTYNVGTGQYFPTLDSAFARLSAGWGILGPVTLLLSDTLYVASPAGSRSFRLVGPIPGAGPTNRITIRPANNVAATIRGDGDAVLWFENVSYLTLDGVSLQGNTRLSVRALYNTQGTSWNHAIAFLGNSDFNIVRNLSARSDDITKTRFSSGILLWDAALGAAPDSNLVMGVSVASGIYGIYVSGNATVRAKGNIIRNCHVGSPNDSLIAWGIQNQHADETIIENNHVENLRLSNFSAWEQQLGINTYASRNTVIRNNIVHNLCIGVGNSVCNGILASGGTGGRGTNVWIYNNMVYDINNRGTSAVVLAGIRAWSQDGIRVHYNAVYLPETGDVPPTSGSVALYLDASNSSPLVRNNILVNMRDDTPYPSTAIALNPVAGVSDYNDLHAGPFASACAGWWTGVLYISLANWQSTGSDAHSVSGKPNFRAPHLHIDAANSALLDGHATPIAEITTDFDGETRDPLAPDIGPDEFVITAVEEENSGLPGTVALAQNYPNPFNPSTSISYQLPTSTHVTLIVYDLLGREVAKLVNENKQAGVHSVQFEAVGLSSGVYFYRMQAGTYTSARKLIVMK